VIEEPAHAAAAAVRAFVAVEAERMAAVMAAVVAVMAMVLMVTSKHVVLDPFRYIGIIDISKPDRVKSDFRYI
jgi:hypothetical protein